MTNKTRKIINLHTKLRKSTREIAEILGMKKNSIIIVNMSGRGDKDLFITAGELYTREWEGFLREEADRLGNRGVE